MFKNEMNDNLKMMKIKYSAFDGIYMNQGDAVYLMRRIIIYNSVMQKVKVKLICRCKYEGEKKISE